MDDNRIAAYHGGADIDKFDTTLGTNARYGQGAYFTENRSTAEYYANLNKGVVNEYNLNISKPFDNRSPIGPSAERDILSGKLKKFGAVDSDIEKWFSSANAFDEIREFIYNSPNPNIPLSANKMFRGADLANHLIKKSGYDGIIGNIKTGNVESTQYLVFDNSQIQKVVPSTPKADTSTEAREAIWKNKDVDQPVRVTENLGKGPDGRQYVKVEGSSTGIPLDEIEFKPKVRTTPLSGSGGSIPPPKPPRASASGAEGAIEAKSILNASKTSDAIPAWTKKAGLAIGVLATAATVIDMGLHYQNEARMRKELRIQQQDRDERKNELDAFDRTTYYDTLDQLNGLPQKLYSNRTGHSNTWGGKKY